MRQQARHSRDEALTRAMAMLNRGVPAEEVLSRLADNLTNKLLHIPSTQIRQAGASERHDLVAAAREIFKLQDPQ